MTNFEQFVYDLPDDAIIEWAESIGLWYEDADGDTQFDRKPSVDSLRESMIEKRRNREGE